MGMFIINQMFVCWMFVVVEVDVGFCFLYEFIILGIMYIFEGEVWQGDQSVCCGQFDGLVELVIICVLCNDLVLDYNEVKGVYEKVGEVMEIVLICLVEKMNVFDIDLQVLFWVE